MGAGDGPRSGSLPPGRQFRSLADPALEPALLWPTGSRGEIPLVHRAIYLESAAERGKQALCNANQPSVTKDQRHRACYRLPST